MLESVEGITFNNINLVDEFTDGEGGSAYFIVNEVYGRGISEVENTLITITGMDGAYPTYTRRPPRNLSVSITMKGESFEDLRRRLERLNEILYTDGEDVPITFDDEPNRTYYGRLNGFANVMEKSKIYKATILIICSDPDKIGAEKLIDFNDTAIIENKGTAEADPIIELTATDKSTFAMISNGEEYNLIGQPADDDVQEVDTKTLVLSEDGSTINEWSNTQDMSMVSNDTNIDGLNGVMGTDGAGIRVESRGSPTQKQNGPAVFKELDTAIQDFEIESTFDIISRREIENWRMMIYFLDENLNPIGHVGVKDNSRIYKRRVALSQLGQHNQGVRLIGDSSYIEDNARDTTLFYLRFKREGKNFKAYIAHWRNQRHDTIWEASYNDVDNQFQGKLKYITLFLGRFQDRVTPNRMRINKVEVSELSSVTVDETPYIIYPNDVVTFDHKNEDILINGEARNDLKNFGASYFKLKKGFNTIVVSPDTFESEIKFRERFR